MQTTAQEITDNQMEFVSLDMNQITPAESGTIDECTENAEEKASSPSSVTPKAPQKPVNEPIANWPHPKWSYLYHDIEEEIPEDCRYLLNSAYKAWKLTAVGYILNFITICFAAFHDNYYESGLKKSEVMFTSMLWVLVAIPFGFLLCYMNLYRAAKQYSTKKWLLFCATFACHMIFAAIIFSGCPWYPCAGIFFTITCFFSGSIVSTVFGVLNCLIWFIVLLLSLAVFHKAQSCVTNNTNEPVKDTANVRMNKAFFLSLFDLINS